MDKYNGIWAVGKWGGSVVTEDNSGFERYLETGHSDKEHYGGNLIAESIPAPFINLISAAPELLRVLEMVNEKYCGNAWSSDRELINQAISKAYGRV